MVLNFSIHIPYYCTYNTESDITTLIKDGTFYSHKSIQSCSHCTFITTICSKGILKFSIPAIRVCLVCSVVTLISLTRQAE